jgi:ABC-type uncharacterized transport system permease subunit
MSVGALGLTLACYLLGAALLGANLLLGPQGPRRAGLLAAGRGFAVLGSLLHCVAIGFRCAELQRAPFVTPAETLSLLAWIVALVYLGLDAFWKLWAAGPFALGLSFLMVVFGAGWRPARGGPLRDAELLGESAISLHITATVGAIAAFALAFCCAALYLIAHRILKTKHGLPWMKRLPPLKTVESVAFVLVALGFPLLTLGILSGVLRAANGGLPAGWSTDPKSLLAYAVWLIYGAYLVARLGLNWPATRTSGVLLVGLALCLLLFLVPSAAHRFG